MLTDSFAQIEHCLDTVERAEREIKRYCNNIGLPVSHVRIDQANGSIWAHIEAGSLAFKSQPWSDRKTRWVSYAHLKVDPHLRPSLDFRAAELKAKKTR